MINPTITNSFVRMLECRGKSYAPNSRLIDDLGLDSQDLVALIMEIETILDRELDDGILLMFASAPIGQIVAHLAQLADESGAG